MKLRKIAAIALALMLVMGCAASTYAAERDSNIIVNFRVKVVDENREPVSGIIMYLKAYGIHSGSAHATTDENGIAAFPVAPDYYYLQELGYEDTGTAYNELYFTLGPLGEVKEDTHHRENVDFEIEEEFGPDLGAVIWPCYDYPEESSYSVSVTLENSDFAGSRVELLNSDGIIVQSWELKEKGELVADLAPGSYTLREIVEINGYEIPQLSNIMVGSGVIIPYDPNPETIEPDFDPADYIPMDPADPSFPGFYYDKFQQWIDNQN